MQQIDNFKSHKRLHIFIADDDQDDIEFFEIALKEISDNIKITKAKNGQELLEFIQYVIPDMIFLDINMPCMNGLDCLSELRRLSHLSQVPIIMYSTGTKPEHVDKSYTLGANLYIRKPTHYASIKEELSRVLAMSLRELIPQPAREKYVVQLQK